MLSRQFISENLRRGTAGFCILVLLLCAAYAPVLMSMFGEAAGSFNYSQNVLFPVVAAALLWLKRDRLCVIERKRGAAGAVFMTAAALALYAYAWNAEKFVTARYSFALAVAGTALWYYGVNVIRAAWAPLLLIFLMVPFHHRIVSYILVPFTAWDREATAGISVAMMNFAGIPAARDGFDLFTSEVKLNVALTCSGINYILNLMVITIVIIYLSRGAVLRRAALLLFVPVVGAAANVARVTANLYVGHRLGANAAMEFYHDAGGIVFALIALGGMLGAARMLGLRYGYAFTGVSNSKEPPAA